MRKLMGAMVISLAVASTLVARTKPGVKVDVCSIREINLPDALSRSYPIEAAWIARDVGRYTGLSVVSGKPGILSLAFSEENGPEQHGMTNVSCYDGGVCSGGDLYDGHYTTYTLRLQDSEGKWWVQKSVSMFNGERSHLIGGTYYTNTVSHDEEAVRTLVTSVFKGMAKAAKGCAR